MASADAGVHIRWPTNDPEHAQLSSDLQTRLQEILGAAYHIDRELGGAGMSRVFVATDAELERQVVIKVLPPELGAGINVDRFRREIQLAARLQHPHIVPLLSAGARDSLLYYTMPFIAGENLRTRLTRVRELPVPEATKILREVADALSYAHSQGVVHRDIKPENILISGNHALVTDFGVSKALSSATSETPTGGPTLTSLGIALGTPAYMAPEQAAADPMVDARADVYSLGVVGYELLAGRTPFSGLNQQQTLSAHITTVPASVTQHRPQLPPGLAAVIMRCLEKHPSDRWQSADELQNALEPYTSTSGASAPFPAAQRKPFKWTPQRIAVAAGIVGIIAAGLIASTIAFRRSGASYTVGSTRQITNAAGLEVHPSVSPDGRMVAFIGGTWNKSQLFVRQLSGGRSIALTDPNGDAQWPKWNSDGSQILYSTREGNDVLPALGGAPVPFAPSTPLYGCTWSNTGDRVACSTFPSGALSIAGPRGENPRDVTGTASGDGAAAPAWSPDDKLIAFVIGNQEYFAGENIGNFAPSSIWVVRADGGSPVRISDNTHLNTSPAWTPDGAVLFVSSVGGNRDVYMQRIGSDLKARGQPVRLTTGLNAHTISIDRSGKTLAYSVFNTVANVWSTPIPSAPVENPQLRPVTTGNQTIESAFVSPDGQWLAYDSNINGNQDIFKMPIAGGEPQQVTHNGADNFSPDWSPDGRQLTFHSLASGTRDVYVMDANGANLKAVVSTPRQERVPIWQPDGNGLMYLVMPDSEFVVRRDPRSGAWGKPRFRFRAGFAEYSPDGRQLLVGAGRGVVCPDCSEGLYIMTADARDPRFLKTPEIDKVIGSPGNVLWSRDSRHMYAALREKDGTSSIWQLPINGDREMRLVHFTDPSRQFYRTTLDVDGKSFYFTIGDRQSDIWTMELKKQ